MSAQPTALGDSSCTVAANERVSAQTGSRASPIHNLTRLVGRVEGAPRSRSVIFGHRSQHSVCLLAHTSRWRRSGSGTRRSSLLCGVQVECRFTVGEPRLSVPSRRGSVWTCGWICGSTSWKPNSRERTRPSSATHNRRPRWTSYGAGAHHDRRTVDIEDQLMRALLRVPGMRKHLTRRKPETNQPQHMRERRDRINSIAKCAEELGAAAPDFWTAG
jgi:hypothetical protein